MLQKESRNAYTTTYSANMVDFQLKTTTYLVPSSLQQLALQNAEQQNPGEIALTKKQIHISST